ncbi:hypothetical protein FSARC_584 [Fusarium sarcochroum]|uniref:Uncharacterized protein n=1 Tax=Fusarium sarcochroum TaxID=1208366 RepID=A0A8H4XF93_9HYPO|nr:hypothetical protein FSARC_584 [Fusarium sarcochroum]
MFERRSLEGLLQICKIPRFASQVHTLDICIRHLLPLDEQRRSDDTNSVEDDTDNDRDTYGTWTSEDSLFRLGGQDELMTDYAFHKCVREALQKLTECKTITFSDLGLPRGICSPEKGVDPSHYHGLMLKSGDSIAFVTKSLDVVLNGPNLPDLEAITFNIGQFPVKNLDGLKPTMLPPLPSSVANVRRLSLHLDQKFLDGPELRTFVKGFPELLELGLKVVDEDWMTGTLPFLSEMAVPKLRKLHLRWLACTMRELNDFLLQHQDTLSHILFYKWINSTAGPGYDQQNGCRISGNATLLEQLSKNGNAMACRYVGATKIRSDYQQNGQTFEMIGGDLASSDLLTQLTGRSAWTGSTCLHSDLQDAEGSVPGTQVNGHTLIFRRPTETGST